MLLKEFPLSFVNKYHDIVVISHNEHHILSQNSETILIVIEPGQGVWDCDHSLEFVPVLDFNQDLEQFGVEVTF